MGRCCGGQRVPVRVGIRVLTCHLLGQVLDLVVQGPLWDGTVDERPGPRRSYVGRTRASLLSCVWIEVVDDVAFPPWTLFLSTCPTPPCRSFSHDPDSHHRPGVVLRNKSENDDTNQLKASRILPWNQYVCTTFIITFFEIGALANRRIRVVPNAQKLVTVIKYSTHPRVPGFGDWVCCDTTRYGRKYRRGQGNGAS